VLRSVAAAAGAGNVKCTFVAVEGNGGKNCNI
jgi:hypothetical protein